MKPLRIPVDEYTTPSPQTVSSDTTLARVREVMRTHGIRHIPIVDDGRAVGILSDRDLGVLAGVAGADEWPVAEVMVRDPFTVQAGSTLEEVVYAMSKARIGSAIVNDGKEIVGIFTSTDAMNALIEILRGEVP